MRNSARNYAGLLADLRDNWPDNESDQRELRERAARRIEHLCRKLDFYREELSAEQSRADMLRAALSRPPRRAMDEA